MGQTMTGITAQKSPPHPRPAAATIADVMQSPLTTVQQHDHAAAAAYLMKHAGTTALGMPGNPGSLLSLSDRHSVLNRGT